MPHRKTTKKPVIFKSTATPSDQIPNLFLIKVRKLAVKFNRFLKYLDMVLCSLLLGVFVWFILKIDSKCIATTCDTVWIDFGGIKYKETFFYLMIHAIIPVLALLGLLRVALTFLLNKREGFLEIFFYFGLGIFGLCYALISHAVDQFVYISAPSSNVNPESVEVSVILALAIIGSFTIFKEKQNWDRASFFTKYRLIFYCINIVFCIVNIKFGIVMFLVFMPVHILVDYRKRNHAHYQHPRWMEEN